MVTEVRPGSVAALNNIKPGNILMEVTQEKVEVPDDVEKRVTSLRKNGRKSALLLVSDGKGELRFVAVPIDEDK